MITKDSVAKALGALEAASPDLAKADGGLGGAEGAATGGGDGSLKAPGEAMSGAAKKAKKSLAKGEFGDGDDKAPPFKKKGKDDDDGDDDDDDDDSMKSFAGDMPQEIKTKIDVSSFLRSLVDHNAATIESMRRAIVKSTAAQADRVEVLLDAVEGLQKSQANIGIVLRAMCERIGVIENQPGVAKSVQAAAAAPVAKSQSAAPVAREFVGGDDGQGQDQAVYKSLTGKAPHIQKAMISEALCQLVMKGEAKDTDVINFETYGHVPGELDAKLRTVLN